MNDSSNIVGEKKSIRARRMIMEIKEALKTQNASSVAAKFPDWETEFPKLFATLLRPECPYALIEMMISQLENVENGKTTQHDASVAVGGVLVNEFVKPQLRKDPSKV